MTPRFSIIVPVPPGFGSPAVEALLRDGHLEVPGGWEIIVAEGTNPSLQRNEAARASSGEYLAFLDSDAVPEADYFLRLAAHFEMGRKIIGGPVLTLPQAGSFQKNAHALLANPVLTGAVSSRYRRSGELRITTDLEVILCNLGVSKDSFGEGFDHRLYPNEENAWIENRLLEGVQVWHDPDLVVRRLQPETAPEFLSKLFHYGRGRSTQSRVRGRLSPIRHLPGLTLLLATIAAVFRPRTMLQIGLLSWLGLALAAFLKGRSIQPKLDLTGALLAPAVPISYAAGQIFGLAAPIETSSSGIALKRILPGVPDAYALNCIVPQSL